MILELVAELSGTILALLVSIKIKSAFLPTSIDPISCSSPKTSAPLIVPIANASLEVKALGFNKLTF